MKNTAVLPRASSVLPTMMKSPPLITARCAPSSRSAIQPPASPSR